MCIVLSVRKYFQLPIGLVAMLRAWWKRAFQSALTKQQNNMDGSDMIQKLEANSSRTLGRVQLFFLTLGFSGLVLKHPVTMDSH